MSFIKPPAAPKKPLAVVGSVKIATNNQDGTLAIYRGRNDGGDKNGNPNLVIKLLFTPDAATTGPKAPVSHIVCVHPLIFDSKNSYDHATAPQYQRRNYEQFFVSHEGDRALFELIFGDDLNKVFSELTEAAKFTHNNDDSFTDETDWQTIGAILNSALEGRLIGYCLQQGWKETGNLTPEGKKERERSNFYEVATSDSPRFFVFNDEPRVPKGFEPTWGDASLPF